MSKPIDRGDTTRRALLEAALIEFSNNGYHAAGNREISLRANANQALIAYHFGNKEGLYLAVFHTICDQIKAHIGPGVDGIEAYVKNLPQDRTLTEDETEQSILLILNLVEGMARLFVSPQMSSSAQLIMYEQKAPTKAFDILYEGFMRRSFDVVADLIQRIQPTISRTEASLIVASILGQTIVFRAARSTLLSHLGWADIGPHEFDVLLKQTKKQVRAILSAKERL